MSKTTIERKVNTIVQQMDGWSYIYDDYRTVNQRLDNTDLPCVIFVEPVTGSLYVDANQYRDSVQANILFAMACELDHDGILLDASVIEKCKLAAIAFIKLCNESGLFEYIETQRYEVFINSYDANVAGIMISPTITELSGICVTDSAEEILENE